MDQDRLKYQQNLKYRCYVFSLEIIRLIDTLPAKQSCRVIGDQVLRSSMSIGANLVESSSSSSRLEFKKFHEIALKSGNETKYWLGLLRDSKLAEKAVIDKLLDEVTQITKMIASGILKLKGKR